MQISFCDLRPGDTASLTVSVNFLAVQNSAGRPQKHDFILTITWLHIRCIIFSKPKKIMATAVNVWSPSGLTTRPWRFCRGQRHVGDTVQVTTEATNSDEFQNWIEHPSSSRKLVKPFRQVSHLQGFVFRERNKLT